MDFQTPEWLCEYMCSLVPKDAIFILEPTPGEGNLVRELERIGCSVLAPSNFWKIDPSLTFDAVVMNPPWSPNQYAYDFLYAVMEITDVIIALMPWYTLINGDRRTDDILDFGLKSVGHVYRRAFRGARVQPVLLEMMRGYRGDIKLEFLKEPYT